MNVRYRVELSQAERCELTAMLSKGKRAARKLKRAQILLAADAGRGDEEIARTVAVRVPPYTGPSGALWKAIWNGRRARSRVLAQSASSPARKKLCWWQRPAPVLPRVAPAGRWRFWPGRWSSLPITRVCRTKRCAGGWPKTASSRGARICGAFQRLMANTSPASTCIDPGARSRSPSGGRQKITLTACANSSMSIIRSRVHPRRAGQPVNPVGRCPL